jgi:hypothetical protein
VPLKTGWNRASMSMPGFAIFARAGKTKGCRRLSNAPHRPGFPKKDGFLPSDACTVAIDCVYFLRRLPLLQTLAKEFAFLDKSITTG